MTNIDNIGKLPPQAVELEEAVIGAIMLEKSAFDIVADILKPNCFYKDGNGLIFAAQTKLYNKSEPIDILTVTNQLRSDGALDKAGGPYAIATLTSRVASAANIEFHARIVQQKFIQRELIRISGEVQRAAFDETADVHEILNSFGSELDALGSRSDSEPASWAETVKEAIKKIESIDRSKGTSGIPSGFKDLDRITKGFQNSEVCIVAGRPGMGKTAWLVSTAINIAKLGIPVDIYSLEMSGIQLVLRALSRESGVEAENLKSGDLSENDWISLVRSASRLCELPIYLDDFASQKPSAVKRKVKKGVKDRGTKIVFIDFLQMMDGSEVSGNRDAQVTHISRVLKQVAKEANIPVVALASLSRAVETRGGEKKPMLSDLRDSGNIESDADLVAFLWMPEYYGFTQDRNGNSLAGLVEIHIAKHRNGATDTATLRFDKKTQSFTDYNYFQQF